MKAIRIHEDGGPEVLRYEDVPDPTPAAGEVLIRLHAASLNHLDVWVRKGLPSVPKPRILGADGAGVVEALGDGVGGFEPGQRVVINPGVMQDGRVTVIGEHTDGTHAELIAVPATNVYLFPTTCLSRRRPRSRSSSRPPTGCSATKAGLREGEWVLVWGIGGGVATAAFQIAKALGARVIATSSSDAKLERARELGADVTVNHESGDVKAAVIEATGGRGADIVIEHVGEATWRTSQDVASQGGRIVVCGATTGPNPPAALHRIWWKELAILGSSMGTKEDFEAAYDLVKSRTGEGRRRLDVPAGRDPRRTRAPGSGRAVREDRPANSRVTG